jgi:hypothetical protein
MATKKQVDDGKQKGPKEEKLLKADDGSQKGSNEERLLKDVEAEIKPFTDFLSKSAVTLGEGVDKYQTQNRKPKGTQRAKEQKGK